MRFTVVRHAGRDQLPATGKALILMDCLTMDPFRLNTTRIESYMGLRVPIETGRPAIAVGGRVNPENLDLGDENVGAVASNGGTARRDIADPKPAQLQITGNCCTRRDADGCGGALAHTRRSSRRGERTGLDAALKWRDSGRRCSTWNTDGDRLRVWSWRVPGAHRLPPIPTFCGPRGLARPGRCSFTVSER
jgi:hypothetical protein